MRHFAITGIETVPTMSSTIVGSAIRATPPAARMSAGTRSSAMTATAPASSAIFACSALTTSMMTPPLSISARPVFTRSVPTSRDDPFSTSSSSTNGGTPAYGAAFGLTIVAVRFGGNNRRRGA